MARRRLFYSGSKVADRVEDFAHHHPLPPVLAEMPKRLAFAFLPAFLLALRPSVLFSFSMQCFNASSTLVEVKMSSDSSDRPQKTRFSSGFKNASNM
ncbi:hypothetical protein TcWFU_006218 [Taenia crassiceps]|uniref:Uncharacterized protein n=1 Tax=Taenia crassiceps TaxID=6207 RepID=A0ABR4Q8Y1_9CEST